MSLYVSTRILIREYTCLYMTLRVLKQNMLCCCVVDLISEEELKGMSSPPRELNHQYFKAPTVLALNTLASTLSRRVCEPLVNPTPKDGKNFKASTYCTKIMGSKERKVLPVAFVFFFEKSHGNVECGLLQVTTVKPSFQATKLREITCNRHIICRLVKVKRYFP